MPTAVFAPGTVFASLTTGTSASSAWLITLDKPSGSTGESMSTSTPRVSMFSHWVICLDRSTFASAHSKS